jgi:hypothetical protein
LYLPAALVDADAYRTSSIAKITYSVGSNGATSITRVCRPSPMSSWVVVTQTSPS